MDQYALTYESKLPFMFELIGSQSQNPPGEHGMTDLQAELWRVVWEKKDEINSDAKNIRTPTVVRQFYLEVEVWGTFCKLSLPHSRTDHVLIDQGMRKTFLANTRYLLSLNQQQRVRRSLHTKYDLQSFRFLQSPLLLELPRHSRPTPRGLSHQLQPCFRT